MDRKEVLQNIQAVSNISCSDVILQKEKERLADFIINNNFTDMDYLLFPVVSPFVYYKIK